MSDMNLFSGKVTRHMLPNLTPGAGGELPALKRLALPQGELSQFHDSEAPIHYIASLELTAGTIRGNHYHLAKVEHVYVMRGVLELIVQEMETGEQATVPMEAGDLVVIQPRVAHALRVLREGVAIEFAPTLFDPTDVHRHPLA